MSVVTEWMVTSGRLRLQQRSLTFELLFHVAETVWATFAERQVSLSHLTDNMCDWLRTSGTTWRLSFGNDQSCFCASMQCNALASFSWFTEFSNNDLKEFERFRDATNRQQLTNSLYTVDIVIRLPLRFFLYRCFLSYSTVFLAYNVLLLQPIISVCICVYMVFFVRIFVLLSFVLLFFRILWILLASSWRYTIAPTNMIDVSVLKHSFQQI